MIETNDLSRQPLFSSLTTRIPSGCLVGLIGPNGAGKTSFLRVLGGILPPTSGRVLWNGNDLLALDRKTLSQIVGYLPQEALLTFPYTVEEVVRMGQYAKVTARFEESFAQFDLEPLRHTPVTQLSGGEKQRTLLARLWAMDPQVWLLDEPMTHLDLAHQLVLVSLLQQEAAAGKTVVLSLHDLPLAERVCDSLILLHRGRLVDQGPVEQVLSEQNLASVFGVCRCKEAIFSLP